VTYQGAAGDAASIHFGPTIKRTNILLRVVWWLSGRALDLRQVAVSIPGRSAFT